MTRPSEAIQRCRCDQEHLEHFYEEVFLELAKFGEAWLCGACGAEVSQRAITMEPIVEPMVEP